MEHYFDLPVTYNGEELNYKGRLSTFGYIYKFFIVIEGKEFVFEKDDEGMYRVLNETEITGKTDIGLIKAIVAVLDGLAEAP